MGVLWKIERARKTHTHATKSVNRISFRSSAHTHVHIHTLMHTHTDSSTYIREMHDNDCTSFRWSGHSWRSRRMETYYAGVNEIWNVNARMWRKRPEDGRQQEEMEIEIANPTLSTSLCIARSASWISRKEFSLKTHLCLLNKRTKMLN